jgi:hypothetical protein
LVVGSLVACGDDGAAETTGASGSSEEGSTAMGSTSGVATSTSAGSLDGTSVGTSDGTGETSSGDASSGGSGLACDPSADGHLWPLAVGNVWHNQLLCSCDCDTMDWALAITAQVQMGGRDAFELHEGCGLTDFVSYYSTVGAIVEEYDMGTDTWVPVFEEPIVDGQIWSDGESQWVAVPEVTVLAGTFTDCFTAMRPENSGPSTTYCPGIGPVATFGFETDLELTGCES